MSPELALLVAAIGLLASFLSGLLGIGGGLVIVPLLLLLPLWLGFERSDSALSRRWGWMYLASGVRAHGDG